MCVKPRSNKKKQKKIFKFIIFHDRLNERKMPKEVP